MTSNQKGSHSGVEQFLISSAAETERTRHALIEESLGFISNGLVYLRRAIREGNIRGGQRLAASIKLEAEAITMQLENLK